MLKNVYALICFWKEMMDWLKEVVTQKTWEKVTFVMWTRIVNVKIKNAPMKPQVFTYHTKLVTLEMNLKGLPGNCNDYFSLSSVPNKLTLTKHVDKIQIILLYIITD